MSGRRDCEHGQLARSCEICELRDRFIKARKLLTLVLIAEPAEWGDKVGAFLASLPQPLGVDDPHDLCRWCDKDERDDHEHGDHVYMPMSLVRAIERKP